MALPLRKALFWLHLGAALTAGLVIVLMAATGLLLSFEAQAQAWADREVRRVVPPARPSSPSLEGLLATVGTQRADLAVTAVTVRSDPSEAMTLALGREGVVYVDPHHARILGPGATGVRKTFRAVTDLHRYLAASGERRELGKAITGAANLAFLVVLASGLYIWVPRVLGRAQLRNSLWFRREVTAKARDFNWHHVFGIWALAPLVLVVVSALPISYEWAANLLLVVTGSEPAPPRPSAAPSGAARGAAPKLGELELAGLDAAVARASAEVPGWRSITVRLPPPPDGKLSLTVDRSTRRGRPDLRTQLVVDQASGAVLEREGLADQSRGRRARSWMRWVHTGEAGGLAGQAVGALACGAVLLLGWTGYALAWRRFRAWRRRTAAAAARVAPASSREPRIGSIAQPAEK